MSAHVSVAAVPDACAACRRALPPSAFGRAGARTGTCAACRVAERKRTRRPTRQRRRTPGPKDFYPCAACRVTKHESAFSVGVCVDGRRTRDSLCRPCRRAYNRDAYAMSKRSPVRRARVLAWRARTNARLAALRLARRVARTAYVVEALRGLAAAGWTVQDVERCGGPTAKTVRRLLAGEQQARPQTERRVLALARRVAAGAATPDDGRDLTTANRVRAAAAVAALRAAGWPVARVAAEAGVASGTMGNVQHTDRRLSAAVANRLVGLADRSLGPGWVNDGNGGAR